MKNRVLFILGLLLALFAYNIKVDAAIIGEGNYVTVEQSGYSLGDEVIIQTYGNTTYDKYSDGQFRFYVIGVNGDTVRAIYVDTMDDAVSDSDCGGTLSSTQKTIAPSNSSFTTDGLYSEELGTLKLKWENANNNISTPSLQDLLSIGISGYENPDFEDFPVAGFSGTYEEKYAGSAGARQRVTVSRNSYWFGNVYTVDGKSYPVMFDASKKQVVAVKDAAGAKASLRPVIDISKEFVIGKVLGHAYTDITSSSIKLTGTSNNTYKDADLAISSKSWNNTYNSLNLLITTSKNNIPGRITEDEEDNYDIVTCYFNNTSSCHVSGVDLARLMVQYDDFYITVMNLENVVYQSTDPVLVETPGKLSLGKRATVQFLSKEGMNFKSNDYVDIDKKLTIKIGEIKDSSLLDSSKASSLLTYAKNDSSPVSKKTSYYDLSIYKEDENGFRLVPNAYKPSQLATDKNYYVYLYQDDGSIFEDVSLFHLGKDSDGNAILVSGAFNTSNKEDGNNNTKVDGNTKKDGSSTNKTEDNKANDDGKANPKTGAAISIIAILSLTGIAFGIRKYTIKKQTMC